MENNVHFVLYLYARTCIRSRREEIPIILSSHSVISMYRIRQPGVDCHQMLRTNKASSMNTDWRDVTRG